MLVRFTSDETVVLLMLCGGGYRIREIARLLKRSEDAVKASFRRIYDKTGMSSQTELIAWFYRNVI